MTQFRSFKAFIKGRATAAEKEMLEGLPDVDSWGEVRLHLRRAGMTDDKLVRVRALWRQYCANQA
jgi:hypothetical protein